MKIEKKCFFWRWQGWVVNKSCFMELLSAEKICDAIVKSRESN